MEPSSTRLQEYQEIVNTTQIHAPISELIGMKMIEVGEGFAKFELEASRIHENSIHTMQGGVLGIMVDASMGIAFGTLIPKSEGFTTLEFKINFLYPVFKGKLIATGQILHHGKKIGLAESIVEIFNEKYPNGKLVAKASSTLLRVAK